MTELRPHTLFDWPSSSVTPHTKGLLCVVGVPTDRGNAIARGTYGGPAAIREASLDLISPNIRGVDLGDIESADTMDLETLLDRLARTVERIRNQHMCPLVLGGDHSITFAPVSVLQQHSNICLVWFDAHTDFSFWSGHASHNHKQVLRRIEQLDGVCRIVQIGHRGLTTGDERNLGPKSVVVTSAEARSLGAAELLALLPRDMPCYISIDIDAIDPVCAPGTSAPVPDGLFPAQVSEMLATITRNRPLVGVDIVEVNPRLDVRAATSMIAARLIHGIADKWDHQLAYKPLTSVSVPSHPCVNPSV